MTTADAIAYFEKRKLILASINLPGLESCEKALEALRLMQEIEEMKPLVVQAKETAELDQMMQEFQKQKPTICVANGVTFATDINDGCKWIPVNERLPECKQDVLMYFDTGNMAVGWWYDRDEVITFWSAYSDDGWYTDCDCEPLYWMPLPEPPKG